MANSEIYCIKNQITIFCVSVFCFFLTCLTRLLWLYTIFFVFVCTHKHTHRTTSSITLSPVVQIDANAHSITPSRVSYKTPSLLVLLEERSCFALMSNDRPSPHCYRSVCAHVSPLRSHLPLHAAVSWTRHRHCRASLISTGLLCSTRQIPGQSTPAVRPDSSIDYSLLFSASVLATCHDIKMSFSMYPVPNWERETLRTPMLWYATRTKVP